MIARQEHAPLRVVQADVAAGVAGRPDYFELVFAHRYLVAIFKLLVRRRHRESPKRVRRPAVLFIKHLFRRSVLPKPAGMAEILRFNQGR